MVSRGAQGRTGGRHSPHGGVCVGVPEVAPDLVIAMARVCQGNYLPEAGAQGLGDSPCLGRVNSAPCAAARGWDAHLASSSPLWEAVSSFTRVLCCPRPARPMAKSTPVSQWAAGSRKGRWPNWDQGGFALSLGFAPWFELSSHLGWTLAVPHCGFTGRCVPWHKEALPWSWPEAG